MIHHENVDQIVPNFWFGYFVPFSCHVVQTAATHFCLYVETAALLPGLDEVDEVWMGWQQFMLLHFLQLLAPIRGIPVDFQRAFYSIQLRIIL